jgi:hypothetical protein
MIVGENSFKNATNEERASVRGTHVNLNRNMVDY